MTTKKVQRIKVSEDITYRFHGNTHTLKHGDHVAEEVFAQFGPQDGGQPMSGWLEAAHSVRKQAPHAVSLYVQYVDVPDPIDPKDARIAELEAQVAALTAPAVSTEAVESATAETTE